MAGGSRRHWARERLCIAAGLVRRSERRGLASCSGACAVFCARSLPERPVEAASPSKPCHAPAHAVRDARVRLSESQIRVQNPSHMSELVRSPSLASRSPWSGPHVRGPLSGRGSVQAILRAGRVGPNSGPSVWPRGQSEARGAREALVPPRAADSEAEAAGGAAEAPPALLWFSVRAPSPCRSGPSGGPPAQTMPCLSAGTPGPNRHSRLASPSPKVRVKMAAIGW